MIWVLGSWLDVSMHVPLTLVSLRKLLLSQLQERLSDKPATGVEYRCCERRIWKFLGDLVECRLHAG